MDEEQMLKLWPLGLLRVSRDRLLEPSHAIQGALSPGRSNLPKVLGEWELAFSVLKGCFLVP